MFFKYISTSWGIAILSWRKDKVTRFILPQVKEEQALSLLNHVLSSTKEELVQKNTSPFLDLEWEIQQYFKGKPVVFSTPIELDSLPPFTQWVLEATATTPWGDITTYQEIAKKIGKPTATRAVGRSLGSNPVPLIIPCHRVVGKKSLGGYSLYGLRWKLLLLGLEKASYPSDFNVSVPE